MRAPRILGLVVGSIALAAVLFLFVLPTRTYFEQKASLTAAEARLQVFRDQNAKLASAAASLQSDAAIERLARQQYGLVKPGEKAYAIVPQTPAPSAASAAPAAAKHAQRGLASRLWHDVQFWN